MKNPLLALAPSTTLLLASCARVCALRNEFQSIWLGGTEAIHVEITLGADDLKVTGWENCWRSPQQSTDVSPGSSSGS